MGERCMKAALLRGYGDVEQLQVGEWPQPQPGPGEVLVRVRAAAVNPKDTFIRKGRFRPFSGKKFPMLMGFDFAGEIAGLGDGVAGWNEGDAVYGMLREVFRGRTCAEYLAVAPAQFAAKPANLSFEEAAALPLASLTALQALRDDGGVQPGDSVCVNGASGGVGSMAVQIARRYGADVTAVSREENHPALFELGARECIDYRKTNLREIEDRFDIFFDVFGNQRFRRVRRLLKPGGTWVSTVLQPHVFLSSLGSRLIPGRRARLVMVRSRHEDLELLRGWVERGEIRPVIHGIYPLSEIADAHRQQESKHSRGKIVIRMDS